MQQRCAKDGLGIRIDDHLHETQRLAALHGATDAGHRHPADQRRAATGPRLALADADPAERRIDEERVGRDPVADASPAANNIGRIMVRNA